MVDGLEHMLHLNLSKVKKTQAVILHTNRKAKTKTTKSFWLFKKKKNTRFYFYLLPHKPNPVRDSSDQPQFPCQSMNQGAAPGQWNYRILVST
jgi:hypothetical protein